MKKALILALALALPIAAGEKTDCCADKNASCCAEQKSCCTAKHDAKTVADDEHAGCDMPKTAEAAVFEMDGKLLCRSCDLHQTEACEKVFQPASDSAKLIAICHGSKVDVEALSGSSVHVKGKMVKCGGDGKEELYIESASKI